MESKREERKREWKMRFMAANEQKELDKKITSILAKGKPSYPLTDAALLAENADLVEEISKKVQERLRQRNLKDERSKEVEDPADSLNTKLIKLCKMIKVASNAGGVVVHTGAGLSTPAGIPDFRGPRGVWTLGAKGQSVEMGIKYEDARPTKAHMIVAEFVKRGIFQHIVTQNVDGLHARSGLHPDALSELHGSVYVERCSSCGDNFFRPFDVTSPQGSSYHRHHTGRFCGEICSSIHGPKEEVSCQNDISSRKHSESCAIFSSADDSSSITRKNGDSDSGGVDNQAAWSNAAQSKRSLKYNIDDDLSTISCDCAGEQEASSGCGMQLVDSIVHFGERINESQLAAAREASSKAALSICLGSSLKVVQLKIIPEG